MTMTSYFRNEIDIYIYIYIYIWYLDIFQRHYLIKIPIYMYIYKGTWHPNTSIKIWIIVILIFCQKKFYLGCIWRIFANSVTHGTLLVKYPCSNICIYFFIQAIYTYDICQLYGHYIAVWEHMTFFTPRSTISQK